MITKLEISQRYDFSTLFYWSYITIDFVNEVAFFDNKIPNWLNEFDMEFLSSISFEDNFKLFLSFSKNILDADLNINTVNVENFQKNIDKINLFDKFSSKEECFDLKKRLYDISIIIHYDNSKNEKYRITNEFPEDWITFGILLKDLLGFDVLNIEGLKYFITLLNFEFKDNNVYLNNKKLKLTKLNYYYHTGTHNILYKKGSFSVDFTKKTICNLINRSEKHSLHNDILFNLKKNLEINDMFAKEGYNKNLAFDGNDWKIELIFENQYILHFQESNVHSLFHQELIKLSKRYF